MKRAQKKKIQKKKELVRQIIFPVMENMGLALTSHNCGVWTWEKEINGVMEKVELFDVYGRVDLRIGMSRNNVWPGLGRKLLLKMEHPRTNSRGWAHYALAPEEGKTLYEDILLDIRDILERFCEPVLRQNADEIKQAVPNRKHYEYMCENREKLAGEYREKLGINGQGILETYGLVAERIRLLCGRSLEEAEKDLMGYAALLEEEILRQYGGVRKKDDRYASVFITEVGRHRKCFNMMADIFFAYKNTRAIEVVGNNLKLLAEKEENSRAK